MPGLCDYPASNPENRPDLTEEDDVNSVVDNVMHPIVAIIAIQCVLLYPVPLRIQGQICFPSPRERQGFTHS